jgi:hypothetical protein
VGQKEGADEEKCNKRPERNLIKIYICLTPGSKRHNNTLPVPFGWRKRRKGEKLTFPNSVRPPLSGK